MLRSGRSPLLPLKLDQVAVGKGFDAEKITREEFSAVLRKARPATMPTNLYLRRFCSNN